MENSGSFSPKNKSSKRIKISRACDECRKRKVKCDGAQPCGRCKKSNIECVFAKLPPKRGPPKQYIENLENRLQRVEKALKSMTAPVLKIFDEPAPQDINSLEVPVELDKFTINEYGQAVYINEKVVRIPEHDTLSDISDSPSSSIIITQPIPAHLSSRDIITEVQPLTEIYFDHVHKYVPMIHKPTFLKQMHQSDPPSRLLLYAMCAVASKWSNDEIPPGYTYYRKALDLLDDFIDSPRVSTIQALILIVKYQEYIQRTGYHHRSYFYLGIAAQMCLDLGLPQLEGDSIDTEIKKRTFWVTFTYDLLLGIEQGHKPYFDVHSCTTGFPLVTGEEGPALEELITNQNIFIQLCKVLSDIYMMARRITLRQQAQGNERNKDQIVEEQARLFSLHTHLENFLFEIPPSLVYPPTQDTENYPVEKQVMADPFIGFLHMTYHFSVILLHSHYSMHPLPETEFGFIDYPHRRLCAVSASNITGIVETMFEVFPKYIFNYPTRGVQHTVHCLAMAAHIHKYEMENGVEESVRVSARLQYMLTVDMIQTLAGQSPSAEFGKYRRRQLTTAEKRMSAPVYQLLTPQQQPQQQQPVDMYVQPKRKIRRNTFSNMPDPALYQSSASITDPTQLATILSQQQQQQQQQNYQPPPQQQPSSFMWPYQQQQQQQQQPMYQDKQKPVYYHMPSNDYIKQEYEMMQPTNMNMVMMPEDEIMMETSHQYDPTPGMSQLFLTDNSQISWSSTMSDIRSEGHVMK